MWGLGTQKGTRKPGGEAAAETGPRACSSPSSPRVAGLVGDFPKAVLFHVVPVALAPDARTSSHRESRGLQKCMRVSVLGRVATRDPAAHVSSLVGAPRGSGGPGEVEENGDRGGTWLRAEHTGNSADTQRKSRQDEVCSSQGSRFPPPPTPVRSWH